MEQLNNNAVSLAREAREMFEHVQKVEATGSSGGNGSASSEQDQIRVAFSIGPTGMMLAPVGNASEEEVKTEFLEQIGALTETVDLFLIETMFDIREALLALEAAKALSSVPVAVTLTFNKNPKGFYTVMGDEVSNAIKRLEDAGADIVGANCSITSQEMMELAKIMRDITTLPILCQPNAGRPAVKDGIPVYEQSPREYADDTMRILDAGINAVGGCCGTTPEFIRELSSRMRN
jgi:5-methyltetrahydrofolate--homocysteine methyltransferase